MKKFVRIIATLIFGHGVMMAGPWDVAMSTYVGGSGDSDSVVGVKIAADGTLIVAANLGTTSPNTGSTTTTLLAGATSVTNGAVLRLSPDGKTVQSVTRCAARIDDMAIDGAGKIYLAVGAEGLLVLDNTATAVVRQAQSGTYLHRVDVTASGYCATLAPTNLGSLDEAPGVGTVTLYDPTGTVLTSYAGKNNTLDLTIDEASQTLITIGWRQANAWGMPGETTPFFPVQIAYLRATDFTGAAKWMNYDWAANTGYDAATASYVAGANDRIPSGASPSQYDPRFLNGVTNNMADTRGLRVVMGADGKCYAGFECAGGNHIFRASPTDLRQPGSVVGGDVFHQFINTGAAHKTYVGRYEPSTGALLLGQQYNSVTYDSLNRTSANAFFIRGGELAADSDGRLMIGGASAYALPIPRNPLYTPRPGTVAFNPFGFSAYLGGAAVIVMSPDFSTREYVTRLATQGRTAAVALRTLPNQAAPRYAFGGIAELDDGPIYTKNAWQPNPGYGRQDGYLAVLGGQPDVDTSAPRAIFEYAGNYTQGTTQRIRQINSAPNTANLDLDGDGPDDSRQRYDFSLSVPMSPTTSYTGPPVYGGFSNLSQNASTRIFQESAVGASGWSLRIQPPAGQPCAQHGCFFFDRSAFGLSPSDVIRFDRKSSLTCDAGQGRWLVRSSGVYYVSEKSIGSGPASMLTFLTDDDDGRWAVWQPVGDLDFSAETAVFQPRNFADIEAVGFLIDVDTFSTNRFWLKWSAFRADFALNTAVNQSPVPRFTASPARAPVPLATTFDASLSTDAEGALVFYAWDFDNGQSSSGPSASPTYVAAGPYEPQLTVWDSTRTQARTRRRVEALPASVPSGRALVGFGGTMGNGNFLRLESTTGVDVDGDGPDDVIRRLPFSATQSIIPSSVYGTRWYGGARSRSLDRAVDWSSAGIRNTVFDWRSQAVEGKPYDFHAVFYVDKTQFLNRGHARPVSFDAASQIKLSGIKRWDQLGQVRWMVKNGSTYFVSEALVNKVGATATLTFATAGDDGRWAEFDPAAEINLDAGRLTFSSQNFADVTGVGFVIDADDFSAVRRWVSFSEFTVEALVTPDPSLPQAQITASPATADVYVPVEFSALNSTASGQIASYAWTFPGGTTASGPVVRHVFTSLGSSTVTLTITDDLGQSHTTDLAYTVAASSYAVWASSLGLFAATDDPESDGRTNFTEYFFGTDPLRADQAAPFQFRRDGSMATFRFSQHKRSASTRYTLYTSVDLQSWTEAPRLEKTPIDHGATWERELHLPLNNAVRTFYRLQLDEP